MMKEAAQQTQSIGDSGDAMSVMKRQRKSDGPRRDEAGRDSSALHGQPGLHDGRARQHGAAMPGAAAHALLLVEDSDDIRSLVADWLREEGYNVIEAADGGSAIVILRAHHPPPDDLCLVLLDMMLPTADGASVLRALASMGNYVPVVAMSADRQQLLRARNAGAQDVMQKPFDLDRLLGVVERNCRHVAPTAGPAVTDCRDVSP